MTTNTKTCGGFAALAWAFIATLPCAGCGGGGRASAGVAVPDAGIGADDGSDGGSTPSSDAGSCSTDSAGPSGAMAGSSTSSGGSSGSNAGESSGGRGPGGNPWISFDPSTVVARSNIVLHSPNAAPTQFMPVGNGTLGAAVWAADGFTAQLNRVDTFPDRRSPGWLTIPGLAAITAAADFQGTLDLYNAVLTESGGGMTARIYVRADSDELVVDVTGADPNSSQTATVSLWAGRVPQAEASGAVATLSQTWIDNSQPGNSGQTFGSLAALTATGRNVQASTQGTTAVTVNFQPNEDGSFRVLCGSPSFNGDISAATVARILLSIDANATSSSLESGHLAWWRDYWSRVGLIEATSSDGAAEYVENLRAIDLYVAAAESRGAFPGSHAGIADLFNFNKDVQDWYPSGYWFWNLRMQVAANMSAGAFDMNAPVFNLYASNVSNMQTWTMAKMGGRAGVCLPETMRFNGNGWYKNAGNQSCDQTIPAMWNSLNISSGAEVGLHVWRQYLMTGDKAFLQTNYPLMSQAAIFLLSYATPGCDGLLHTQANAHETQWNVTDPITNIAAMRALFPAVIAAAQLLGTDESLVTDLRAAIPLLPDFPRTNPGRTQVLTSSSDSSGDIFAFSTQPFAALHNSENLDLEPVWPYDLIGDTSPEFAVELRTYGARRNKDSHDWTNDPIHAARLGLATEVSARLTAEIGLFQTFPCGLASLDATRLEPYVEQIGVLTTAINEALVQDYDGTVRIAPAWPPAWDAVGTVYIQGSSKVHVRFQSGAIAFAVLEVGTTGTLPVRNPWTAAQAAVIDDAGQQVVAPTTDMTLSVPVQQGHSYLIMPGAGPAPMPVRVTGSAATTVKTLNARTIGVP